MTNEPAAEFPIPSPVVSVSDKSANESVDLVTEQLFRRYVISGGKIPTSEVKAAIELVAARGRNPAFSKTVLSEFEKSCEDENRTVRRNLLELMSKMLAVEGSQRWRYERARRTDEVELSATTFTPTPSPKNEKIIYSESKMLERVIARGRHADRHDMDAFVIAVRQAHHPQGKQFLLDVLRNPPDPLRAEERFADDKSSRVGDRPEPERGAEGTPGARGKWPDNRGGSWLEAKFHAAVGLAELGEPAGVEWLIKESERNDFGVGSMSASLNHAPHYKAVRSNLRESCLQTLADLSGRQATDDMDQWNAWWAANQDQFEPRPVALQID
ncbi:MAG: hypothetical protein WDZ59_03395 [Pirellulales bacterium]